jgi:hypothetical protein
VRNTHTHTHTHREREKREREMWARDEGALPQNGLLLPVFLNRHNQRGRGGLITTGSRTDSDKVFRKPKNKMKKEVKIAKTI